MKRVINPKTYEKVVEYWDKGDGRSNALQTENKVFQSPDINDSIRDAEIKIPAGESIILHELLVDSLVKKYSHLIVEDYVKPKLKKKIKKVSKKKKKYEKKKKK